MVEVIRIRAKDIGHSVISEVPVVDVETIDSLQQVRFDNTKLRPSIVGIFYKDQLTQFVLKNPENIALLRKMVKEELDSLPQPFYAFNKGFDHGVIFGLTGKSYRFGEIQEYRFQKKQKVKEEKGIDVFDPFNGDGYQAIVFYKKYLQTGNEEALKPVVLHNQACLLTECYLHKMKGKE